MQTVNDEQKLVMYSEQNRQRLAQIYRNDKQVPVTVSPFYASQLGSNVPLIINGITIYVQANGKTHYIPQTYANLLAQKIHRANTQELRQGVLSNVSQNFEHQVGELKFF